MNRPFLSEPSLEKTAPTGPVLACPGTVWLDSSLTIHDKGYRSLFAANPVGELIAHKNRCSWKYRGKEEQKTEDGWRYFSQLRKQYDGWWIGGITYEAMLPFVGLAPKTEHSFLPDLHFYLYESVSEIQNEPSFFDFPDDESPDDVAISAAISKTGYLEQVRQIQKYIREGDIYQANLTTRFIARTNQNPITVYKRLRALNPAPYAAYVNFGKYQLLSSSPERMFSKQGNSLVTSPIKGTIARGDKTEEENNRSRLFNSEKDRAELLMIVDLERNDIGRVAEIGSVSVEPLIRTETYSSLIHLVSDIQATLHPRKSTDDVVAALLPGGSITGAPKRRAVEILSEIEPVARGIYTGCIGYFHGDDAEFNIAIRTIIHHTGEYHIHAGGGIVADSDPEAEYEEMQLKARNLFRALQPQVKTV